MLESAFRKEFLQKLEDRMDLLDVEISIVKVDPPPRSYPDRIILSRKAWAALEFKRQKSASKQPNQGYYVDFLNRLSYASFVNPENGEEVLDDLERLFTT